MGRDNCQSGKELKKCDFCNAHEDKLRPVGAFIVKLKTIEVFGEEKNVCQSCVHKNEEIRKSNQEKMKNKKDKSKLMSFVHKLTHVAFIAAGFSAVVMAQPGLPGAPSQAPIDGGLSILAAAGGAYAIKKLRDKKAE